MAKGGVRPGAGRPKGSKDPQTLIKQQALQILREKVLAEIGPITEALIAKGLTGDVQAIRELFDRAFGKAPQAITDADGESLVIAFDTAFKTYASLSSPAENSEQ
jgi:hypothetical protein